MIDQALQLVPLRIPTGWKINFNNFYMQSPIIEDGEFINSENFGEDMLQIERIVPDNVSWPQFIIDLGWIPGESVHGQYQLSLMSRDSDDLIKVNKNNDIGQMQLVLDQWLNVLSSQFYDYAGVALLQGDYESKKSR